MNEKDRDKLEIEFVDKYGLAATLEAIADICLLKADHIKTNWEQFNQGNSLSRQWESFRSKIDTCRAKLQNDANFVQGK